MKQSVNLKTGHLKLPKSKKQKEKRMKKRELSPGDIWDIIKQTNIHIKGVSKGRKWQRDY